MENSDESNDKGFMSGLIDLGKDFSWKAYAIGAVIILVLLLVIYWYFFTESKKENNEVKRKKKSDKTSCDNDTEQIDKLIDEIKEKQNNNDESNDSADE